MRRDSKPLVRNDLLVADGPAGCAANPVRVGHESWYAWLTGQSTFIYEGGTGRFTARLEHRRGIGYWYGYRRRNGKLAKTYLGKSGELTPERLEQAGAFLAGQIPLRRLMSDGHPTGLLAAPSPTDTAAASLGEMTSLPLTKVKPPALPEKLVARARLTQRIDRPVTFVNAPSGFGKTTLLNEWRQGCGMPVAWVALNADDDHPLRFWSTVVTALQTVDPSLGQSWLSQLHSSSPSTLSEIVVNLTNDIIRASDAPNAHHRIGLVLDDYHHIQHPGIHTSLQTWLEHIPPTLKLVVASSTKPPLVLGYLQARGMVVELGADDLRFTLEEGTEFLQQHSPGRHLVYGDMQTLVKRTEGWITGLVLATCVLAQQGKRSSFMEAFTGAHSLLREFFATSVLQRQAPAVQTFLLKTSILRHLTAPLCDAVTGQRGAAGMLARLWEERLFLERLEEANWYRYHDLFRETLCAQLQEQCPAEIPRLHRQAAQWYQAQNAPADAVCHLLAIEAWEEAAVLLESVALRELEHLGEDSRLLHWLQHLPEAVVQQHRALLALYVRLAGIALPSTAVESLLARTELSMAARSPLEKP
ncbi:MAG TPA: hypothetical protein PLG21_14180, partial [Anaerolineae bacterium]|nr:hypothetical protein [Anaerolineae bacterium]